MTYGIHLLTQLRSVVIETAKYIVLNRSNCVWTICPIPSALANSVMQNDTNDDIIGRNINDNARALCSAQTGARWLSLTSEHDNRMPMISLKLTHAFRTPWNFPYVTTIRLGAKDTPQTKAMNRARHCAAAECEPWQQLYISIAVIDFSHAP